MNSHSRVSHSNVRASVYVLVFLPSVTFGLLQAEIMPWALIIALLFWRYVSVTLLFILFLLSLNILIFNLYQQQLPSDSIRSFAAYANVLIPFFAILSFNSITLFELKRALSISLYLMLAVGALQLTGILALLGGNRLIAFLVERGLAEQFGNGRGITLLSSEPSRAGYEFVFISATFIQFYLKNPQRQLYADLAMLLMLILVIKSAIGLAFGAVYFVGKYGLKAAIPIAVLIGGLSFLSGAIESRAISIIWYTLDEDTIYDAFVFLMNQSGFRLISVYSAYIYGIMNPFGGGIGFWETTSLLALEQSGFDAIDLSYFRFRTGEFFAVRPTSFVSSLFLDTGWLAVLVVYFVVYSSIRLLGTSRGNRGILAAFFFFIFVVGSIGNPVPWICVALLVKLSSLDRQCRAKR